MKYTAQIIAKKDIHLEKIFQAEEKNLQNNRSRYEVKKSGDKVRFEIEAEDAVALKAALNSIAKVLQVHEKTSGVCKND